MESYLIETASFMGPVKCPVFTMFFQTAAGFVYPTDYGTIYGPGARFSKVPVTSGPDNLSGPLSGNFIGPDVAFLEAPVNFPGNFRAR